MRLSQVLKLDLREHWVKNRSTRQDGQELPASVVARWSFFACQARRSKNGYFLLECLALGLAAAVPVSAALGASVRLPAVLGAGVVVTNGLRQIFRFHEEWISSAGTRYAIEREIVLFLWDSGPYKGPEAVSN